VVGLQVSTLDSHLISGRCGHVQVLLSVFICADVPLCLFRGGGGLEIQVLAVCRLLVDALLGGSII